MSEFSDCDAEHFIDVVFMHSLQETDILWFFMLWFFILLSKGKAEDKQETQFVEAILFLTYSNTLSS